MVMPRQEQVRRLEKIICSDMPNLLSICSVEGNPELGRLTGTTGGDDSRPLAMTQLLITYPCSRLAIQI